MAVQIETPTTARTCTLFAPLSGFLVPIERVPDPVFSQKMVGDGIALDPTSQTLIAPCDGEVVMLHPAHHALTLATADGIELLMHIGLDTINLKGEGFRPRVQNGDKVKAGAPLIDFDADFIATHAKSLLSMIVVTDPGRVASLKAYSGMVTAGRDPILEVELALAGEGAAHIAGAAITSEALLISNTAGLGPACAARQARAGQRPEPQQ